MIPDRLIVVGPVPGGWCVQTDRMGDLMFLSGALAEEKAGRLAMGIAAAGLDVRVDIHDRHDLLVTTRCYFAQQPSLAKGATRAHA
ncbi:MAG: hypothetical protein E7812_10320 [Phenylobacterium sp.]|nr:MAG: hypothetical protein E7812_10320 [Phenylobacterium sp.]